MSTTSFMRLALAASLALAAAGCGTDDDGANRPSVASTSEVATTAPVPGPTSPSPGTSSAVENSSTVVPSPAATTGTEPTSTSSPTVTSSPSAAPPPGAPAPTSAVTMDGFDLVERDAASGAVVRVIVADFAVEATYPTDFTLSDDRSQLYFAETIEDYWYACESSPGQVFVAELATGARTLIGTGAAPALSPDGTKLAYLEASQCLPDPEAPDFWVIAPLDRAVVLDLTTGARTEFPTSELPTAEDDPAALAWVGFDDDRTVLVATVGGDLWRIDGTASADVSSGELIADLAGREPVEVGPTWIIAVAVGDEGSVDVYRIERDGGAIALLARSEYAIRLGVSSDGHVIVAHDAAQPAPTDLADGVTVLPVVGLYAGIDW